VVIKVQRLHPKATLPAKNPSLYEAGWDIYSCLTEPVVVGAHPSTPAEIPTGIAVDIPPGFMGLLVDRSSLAKLGLAIVGGCIDCTYRGELRIFLQNNGYKSHTIPVTGPDGKPPRVAQMLILPVPQVTFEWSDTLSASPRGIHGFGSTGV